MIGLPTNPRGYRSVGRPPCETGIEISDCCAIFRLWPIRGLVLDVEVLLGPNLERAC